MDGFGFEKRGILGDKWPKDEKGEPEMPAFLERISGLDLEIEMQRNMLEAFGIPTVLRYPGDGSFGRVVLGVPGTGADLFVPESMLEDAKNIISADVEDDEDIEDK